ncbi:MAG: PilZ domain-containing protein [Deltaproteobacteria bacterium]|nr:PilZ domain-containing protein [Deltaproteobacteria bacterium]
MTENRLKISSQERIQRILVRVCEAKIPLVLRVIGANSAIAIKARAHEIGADASGRRFVGFSGVSKAGIEMIEVGGGLQVEFATMATKIMFSTPILERGTSWVRVGFPKTLVSLERRSSDRYLCRDHLMSFLSFSLWGPKVSDVISPPFYEHQFQPASMVPIADISAGGVCIVTRFPSLCNELFRGVVDKQAHLHMPMQPSIPVEAEVRWIKKIKEHMTQVNTDTPISLYSRHYRLGIQFRDPSDSFKLAIKQFTQQLALKDAI